MSTVVPALHIYGLAFFAMGLAIWLKTTPLIHLPISRTFRWLAVFGITNGIHHWMLLDYQTSNSSEPYYHAVTTLFAVSYMALGVFAVRIVDPAPAGPLRRAFQTLPFFLFGAWLAIHVGWHWLPDADNLKTLDMLVHQSPRYLLAAPSALLAAYCFARLSRLGAYGRRVRRYAQASCILFVNFAALSLFTGAADPHPASVLNDENFQAVIGIPVYLLSAITAAGTGFCFVSALTLFDKEERNKLNQTVREATTSLDNKIAELEAALADRQETEERLEEQATLFQTVLDNVPAPVMVRDTELRFTFLNRQAEAHFKRPAAELIGKTVAETFPAGAAKPFEDFLQQALSLPPGQTVTIPEHQPIHWPEKAMWICAAPVIKLNGQKRGVVTISLDLTNLRIAERKLFQSESLMQSMLDHIPGTVGLRSLEGEYQVLGAGCAEWHQMAKEEMIGKRVDEIWGHEQAQAIMDRDQETASTGVPATVESLHTFPNGVERMIRVLRFPVRNADGSLRGIGFMASDISAERRAEDQWRQAQKMEAVGQLTGGVAHDFNNLLGVIIGNLDFLEEQLRDNEEQHSLVTAATNAALHGASLNRQLLAFSRKQALEPKEIDLNTQIPGMVEMLRRSLPATISVTEVQAPYLWHCIADASQVETALLNMALNARDAMPEGGVLTIDTANSRVGSDTTCLGEDLTPGDYVVLSVSDTGTGMSADALKHAFEPFFTTKPVGQGSGLGLSMIYGFAKQSGGHVTIKSEDGRGTTVRLFLPRHARIEDPITSAHVAVDLAPQTGFTNSTLATG